jgi:eukaryotic-like serine/threonine-protein kinase
VSAPDPETFGKYRIIERIASSGTSEVYKARLDGVGGFHRHFAIKRFRSHLSADPAFAELLVDEAKAAGLLSHANIVQILDLGRVDDQYYIAMEYVAGTDLGRILSRCREKGITLPVPHAVYVAIEALKGLEYAHNRQVMRDGRPVPLHIVHRDITPSNVLVSAQGEVKLTDFGMARSAGAPPDSTADVASGRLDYLSPEQVAGHEGDVRSDLFALGTVLVEMLTGEHPFRKDTGAGTLEAILLAHPTPPSHVNMDVPAALDDVVARVLASEPADRHPNAAALKEDLDRFFQESEFIFTPATLATFVQGLFPPAPPRTGSPPLPREGPARPRPPEESIHEAADLLRRLPDPAAPPDYAQPGLSDASTLIRGNPALNTSHSSVQPLGEPGEPGEAAGPSEGTPHAPPRPSEGTPVRDRSTAPLNGRITPVVALPTPLRSSPALARPRAGPARSAPLGLLVLSMITLLLGLAVGYVAGQRAHVTSEAVGTLELRAPNGAEVTIDGERLTGAPPWQVSVIPDRAHTVGITLEGRNPLEVRVSLSPGQTRVLDIEAHSLQMARP